MSDTDALRPYKAPSLPSDPESQARYLSKELQQVSTSLALIIEVMKKLEARLVVGGL